MKFKFCPKCSSENVVIDGSMVNFSVGAMMCKKCGFKNLVFPIKEKLTKLKNSTK